MHVLEHNAITLRKRENCVDTKQRCGIASGKEFRADLAANRFGKLVEVAQAVAWRISSMM